MAAISAFLLAVLAAPTLAGALRKLLALSLLFWIFVAIGAASGAGIFGVITALVIGMPVVLLYLFATRNRVR